jgi:hypothetical protein
LHGKRVLPDEFSDGGREITSYVTDLQELIDRVSIKYISKEIKH